MSEDINARPPAIFLDYAEQQGGFKKPPDGLKQDRCPKCNARTLAAYGLLGGGVGAYVCCEACDWFYKEQSKDGA